MNRPEDRPEVTELLEAWSAGKEEALDELVPLVMEDLRGLARAYMARESPGHTLQPTELVNEAFLRIVGRRQVRFKSRVQLFAVLAETMRRILVDHARRKKAERHGGGTPPVPIEEAFHLPVQTDVDLVHLDDALQGLASFAPRQSEIVTLSYFGGLSFDAISEHLGVSPATVKRDLKAAKIWLLRELRDGAAGSPS